MQEIGELAEIASQPISLAVEPKLGRDRSPNKTPQALPQRPVGLLIYLCERNC
jgi:hypothetical protein